MSRERSGFRHRADLFLSEESKDLTCTRFGPAGGTIDRAASRPFGPGHSVTCNAQAAQGGRSADPKGPAKRATRCGDNSGNDLAEIPAA